MAITVPHTMWFAPNGRAQPAIAVETPHWIIQYSIVGPHIAGVERHLVRVQNAANS